MAACGPSKLPLLAPLARGCCCHLSVCRSTGHSAGTAVSVTRAPIKGDNQLSSCGAQRGYCNLPSPPLVLVLSLGGQQLPDVQTGKDSTIQSLPDLFKA